MVTPPAGGQVRGARKHCGQIFFQIKKSNRLNFYSHQENALFFYPSIENYNSFELLVYENAPMATVCELAEVCCMSVKHLRVNLKLFLEQYPSRGCQSKKKQKVLIEVYRAKSGKKFPEKPGFSSYAYLNSYCMKQFDTSLKDSQSDR